MKIVVKTLKGTRFDIEVSQQDTVADVKKIIEKSRPSGVYPAVQQILIHQGKVLKDATTMEENQVAENSFVVIMLSKTKPSTSDALTTSAAPVKAPQTSVPPPKAPTPSPTPTPAFVASPAPAPPVTSASHARDLYWSSDSDDLTQAWSRYEGIIQQMLDMGGGMWDRATVDRALGAALNNPEIAVEYLYSGIPEHLNFQPLAQSPEGAQPMDVPSQLQRPSQPTSVPSSGPNTNPLDLFPQVLPNVGTVGGVGGGTFDFLRNSPQFNMLRPMVHENPQMLQPMFQELAKQNPNLMRLIDDNQSDFLRLMNEPVEGIGGNPLGGLAGHGAQQITVTPQECESIERLEAMGFDRATVLEAFFACNKNEELAANYLLDNMP